MEWQIQIRIRIRTKKTLPYKSGANPNPDLPKKTHLRLVLYEHTDYNAFRILQGPSTENGRHKNPETKVLFHYACLHGYELKVKHKPAHAGCFYIKTLTIRPRCRGGNMCSSTGLWQPEISVG